MKTLNEHLADKTEKMKDVITMKQQHQTPSVDQESNVSEQYLLKYGGSRRVLEKYFAIQRAGDASMIFPLKQLKLMTILTSL